MIVTLALSRTRHRLIKAVDSLLFEARMRDIDLKALSPLLAVPVFLAIGNNQVSALDNRAADILPHTSAALQDTLQVYSIPAVYTLFELFKIRKHLLFYGKLKYKQLKDLVSD